MGGAGRNDKETKRGGQDAGRQTTGSIISPQECPTLTMHLFLQLLIYKNQVTLNTRSWVGGPLRAMVPWG